MAGKIEFGKIAIKRSSKFIVQINFPCGRLVIQVNPRRNGGNKIVLFVGFSQKDVVVILSLNIDAGGERPLGFHGRRRENDKN